MSSSSNLCIYIYIRIYDLLKAQRQTGTSWSRLAAVINRQSKFAITGALRQRERLVPSNDKVCHLRLKISWIHYHRSYVKTRSSSCLENLNARTPAVPIHFDNEVQCSEGLKGELRHDICSQIRSNDVNVLKRNIWIGWTDYSILLFEKDRILTLNKHCKKYGKQ